MFACRRSAIWMAVMALATATANATPIDRLPKKNFVYDAKQIPLVDVLRDFAGGVGLPIVVAEGVSGTVNANFSLAPRAFLDLISRSFGLIWYFDGTVLHIYPSGQIQSRLYKMVGSPAADFSQKLTSFGVLDPRYPVTVVPGSGGSLVFASGPPRHIELIEALIDVMSVSEPVEVKTVLRSFPLMHASAVDRTVQGTTLPGIASTLSGIFGKGPRGGGGGGGNRDSSLQMVDDYKASSEQMTNQVIAAREGMFGSPQDRGRQMAEARGIMGSFGSQGGAGAAGAAGAAGGPAKPSMGVQIIKQPDPAKEKPADPVFMADEATNTVIVRATESQLAEIAQLIKQLDVPSHMVEVEATIIDISSDEVRSLGFDWRFDSNSALNQVQLSPAISTTTTSGAIPQGTGFNITTLLAAGGKELLARIRALEARGTARVVSQPKVLGAANRTAVLSDTRTASVRVAGNQDARLYSVETGTKLRVTPRLVKEGDATRIGLELLIEDGGFSTESVDEVPVSQKTLISTIATLNEGQALLVGGIESEGSSGGRSGIPYLSKLPLIGGAFKFDSAQSSRRQRLFLITPKRVQLDVAKPLASASPALNPAPVASEPAMPVPSGPAARVDAMKLLRDRYARTASPVSGLGCTSASPSSDDGC